MFDPKADFTYRQELMRICLDRGISQEKMNEIIAPMQGYSHEEKERIAKELIPLVNSGIYDCYPKHFYHKTEWRSTILRLYDEDNISYATVRPIVESILQYCALPVNSVEMIFSHLHSEEHLREMYNWLMEQLYIPEESACICKAKEIDASLEGKALL